MEGRVGVSEGNGNVRQARRPAVMQATAAMGYGHSVQTADAEAVFC